MSVFFGIARNALKAITEAPSGDYGIERDKVTKEKVVANRNTFASNPGRQRDKAVR
jgi:hypothetical protein